MSTQQSRHTLEEALCAHYIFNNGIAFNDYFVPQAWRGKPYLTRYYQFAIVLAEEAVIVGGRSWGKSVTLEAAIVKVMINGYGVESVLTSFRRLHIRDREERIISYFETIPYFKMFLCGKDHTIRESVNRSPVYTIKLLNGHIHFGISIGDDPLAVNIQGPHPCLHPDQGVRLANGKMLPIRKIISRIKKGEDIFVQSFDFKQHMVVQKKVLDGWYSDIGNKKMLRVVFEDNSNILFTNNHKLYDSNGNKKRADEFKIGDYAQSNELDLSDTQRSLVVGTVLGDGCLAKETWYRNGKRKYATKKYLNIKDAIYRIIISHASAHKDNVQSKYIIVSIL